MVWNGRKRMILAFLAAQRRPATVAEIAWSVRLPYHSRGLYGLLERYSRWGLILRHRGPDGRLCFRLGERGRARLAWLARKGGRR